MKTIKDYIKKYSIDNVRIGKVISKDEKKHEVVVNVGGFTKVFFYPEVTTTLRFGGSVQTVTFSDIHVGSAVFITVPGGNWSCATLTGPAGAFMGDGGNVEI
jgi:hypothetical protein